MHLQILMDYWHSLFFSNTLPFEYEVNNRQRSSKLYRRENAEGNTEASVMAERQCVKAHVKCKHYRSSAK